VDLTGRHALLPGEAGPPREEVSLTWATPFNPQPEADTARPTGETKIRRRIKRQKLKIGPLVIRKGAKETHRLCGVCAILLRVYTSTERLKRVYTSPGPLLEICYFT
jgi:hypothetical protein